MTTTSDLINQFTDSLQHGGSPARVRHALETVAAAARADGREQALLSLRTIDDAAQTWGVSRQRAHIYVSALHERFGVGMRVGARSWLLTQGEIDAHPPARPGRPRKTNSAAAT